LLSRFPKENLIYKNTGQGFSGLIICLIRFITIFSSSGINNDQNKRKTYEMIIFNSLNVLTSIASIILLIVIFFAFYLNYKVLFTKKNFISRFENNYHDSLLETSNSESNILPINNVESI